jgi:putative ABC transport system permease protein
MSAVWSLARAAVRRRKVQTTIIGFVALVSAVALVLALGLLSASSSPFDRAFDQQHGAQVVATFNRATVSDTQLAETAGRSGVTASAGPFPDVVVEVSPPSSAGFGLGTIPPVPPGPLSVVGRASPTGAVDDVDLWSGQWATSPGQIVLDRPDLVSGRPSLLLGRTVHLSGGQDLTVVGVAYSLSESAGAWVAPAEVAALHPTGWEMLYRFQNAATAAQVRGDVASVKAGLPHGALVGSQSYLSLEQEYATTGAGPYVPFLFAFGILALVVAVVIVANVVSGTVVSGLRQIGMMKALGYTPRQVLWVYLLMTLLPATLGCILGAAVGTLASKPLLSQADQGIGLRPSGVSLWVNVVVVLGLPAVVVLAAVAAAWRAKRLPAAQAISAGAAPAAGRGLRTQRALAGTRLPRAVSLGLGFPFARPARTMLTVATLVLGVTTVTLATGLTSTAVKYGNLQEHSGSVQLTATVGNGPGQGAARVVNGPGQGPAPVSAASDRHLEQLLRSLPGIRTVTANLLATAEVVGSNQSVNVDFVRGDSSSVGYVIVKGHWIDAAGQAVVGPGFLKDRDLSVGDRLTLSVGGATATVTIVGETWSYDSDGMLADWHTANVLEPGRGAVLYDIGLTSGTNLTTYVSTLRQADPSLLVLPNTSLNTAATLIAGFSSLFTVLLAIVAALGVLNTVLLTVRERRRDLGMLKSIGMTPRQVTAMMVTSVAALGLIGSGIGVPFGIVLHRLIVPDMVHAANIVLPAYMLDVWSADLLVVLVLSGMVIAGIGAFFPARTAGRIVVAAALHNE